MGQGLDLARAADPGAPHHDLLENMRDQLIIALLKKLMDKDGNVAIPVEDVDNTGDSLVMFWVDQVTRTFHFEVRKKS